MIIAVSHLPSWRAASHAFSGLSRQVGLCWPFTPPASQSVSQERLSWYSLMQRKDWNLSHWAEVLSKLRPLWTYLPGEEEKPHLMLTAPSPCYVAGWPMSLDTQSLCMIRSGHNVKTTGKGAKILLEWQNHTEMTTVMLRKAMSLPSPLPLGYTAETIRIHHPSIHAHPCHTSLIGYLLCSGKAGSRGYSSEQDRAPAGPTPFSPVSCPVFLLWTFL